MYSRKLSQRDILKVTIRFRGSTLVAAYGLWAWASILAGCAGTQKDGMLDYARSAELHFQEGMDEFEDEDCVSAEKIFGEVRRKFPYSRFAVLSELRLADCQFIQGSYATAAVSYQQFVKAHPTHEEAPYAAYRRGVSFYEMIPGDYVITPPPHERDQAATRDARASLDAFIKRYPSSEYVEPASELLKKAVRALVQHEIYVAEFYLSRGDRRAAAVRLEGVQDNFPESDLVPDAMFLQAITFLEMDRKDSAKKVFEQIRTLYPEHYQSRRAKDYLRHLELKQGDSMRGSDG